MSFHVEFVERTSPEGLAYAEIDLNGFKEAFQVDLSFWSRRDYETQWRQAVERIIAGESRSCLIASMPDPATANFVFTWPMYALGDEVAVQNRVMFMDEIQGEFDPLNPYVHLGPRETLTEEGAPISEWRVSAGDLVRYLGSAVPMKP